jgi:protease-4
MAMLMALACTLGCMHQPLRLFADGDILADADVRATIPPTSTNPLVPMSVPPETANACLPRVAVIDVDGILLNTDFTGVGSMGENPVSLFRERLDQAAGDPGIVAVVVRINSPGGGVTASDMMWHDLCTFRRQTHLPVIACLLDVGAGGAYYLATAADQIVAHPTSVVGGIGVILNLYNMQDTMAQFNVVGVPIKSGKKIDVGSPVAALEPEDRQLLQTMADSFHERFRRVVREARPGIQPDAANFDGRVFTAEQALDRGLIDSVGYLNDAIEMAARAAGRTRATVTIYHRPEDRAASVYAVTPNVPWQNGLIPASIPGLDRSRLPTFLYLWQLDPTLEKLGGK